MSAQAKIEKLTNSWYGFNLFAGVMSLLMGGIGFFSMVWAALSTAFTLVVTYIIGRKLMNRSSLTRSLLLVASTVLVVLGVVGLVLSVLHFEFSVRFLLRTILVGTAVSMHVKSIRVLTDRDVKAYFA
jgi:hypothetical protein